MLSLERKRITLLERKLATEEKKVFRLKQADHLNHDSHDKVNKLKQEAKDAVLEAYRSEEMLLNRLRDLNTENCQMKRALGNSDPPEGVGAD